MELIFSQTNKSPVIGILFCCNNFPERFKNTSFFLWKALPFRPSTLLIYPTEQTKIPLLSPQQHIVYIIYVTPLLATTIQWCTTCPLYDALRKLLVLHGPLLKPQKLKMERYTVVIVVALHNSTTEARTKFALNIFSDTPVCLFSAEKVGPTKTKSQNICFSREEF